MTDHQHEALRRQLLQFAGEDRYRRFVATVQGWRPGAGRLTWWQERLLREFAEETGNHLPAACDALKALFDSEFPVRTLSHEEVPAWCQVEDLSTGQAFGTCDEFKWYFSAKHGSWSLAVATDVSVDPAEIDDPRRGFYKEKLYGDGRSGASWISDAEARYLIVSTLREFRRLQTGEE